MNEKDITNNKRFWETVKCYLSNKTKSSKKITRIEDDDIISDKKKNAESFDISLIQNECESFANNISHPTSKAIVEYRNNPSILVIGNTVRKSPTFHTGILSRDETLKEIKSKFNKATQDSNISMEIIKENTDIFTEFLSSIFN